ncbi:MAG: FAD-dependent oxidoreductase [Flavobacteriales bacterium]|nr:MAG: FAD-dependent oxidoreductase [Flavobacteriales bacterium]
MITNYKTERELKHTELHGELVVAGGGLAGVCAAITAARAGVKVTLVQDRPVLGGNASSEVRLWILGATSHMGNNNRWAREGGVIDEILVENTFRNVNGNALIFDTILLDMVTNEPNITLFLNTAIYQVEKNDLEQIKSVSAFCSQNQTNYSFYAPLFCDATGDGIVGFLAGAAFRMGAESKEEFGERFAPSKEYGELLGHSLYFYSKNVGQPVKYVAPSYALKDITKIPRFKNFNALEYGCNLWWLEYGGRLDTIHDTEDIKWELWKVAYGAWDYIKNSGNFPEAANLTLEWIGTIPGKRESRRFEGDYMLRQQDIVDQQLHYDAVAYGGWSIDLHPADGVFSEKPGCNQWHGKGIYQIPYRCLYSRNVGNLFLAGRIISASHVAFGSSRVMATCAHAAQAVGLAAKLCITHEVNPAAIGKDDYIVELQQELLRSGQHIPEIILVDPLDLVKSAKISASSEFTMMKLDKSADLHSLDTAMAQMIPLQKGKIESFTIAVFGLEATELSVELRVSSNPSNHTPEEVIARKNVQVGKGYNEYKLDFAVELKDNVYVFLTFLKNPAVQLCLTDQRVTGILSVFNKVNKKVSNNGKQVPPPDIGVHEFEFWTPERRPLGKNIAFSYSAPTESFCALNVCNGIDRPVSSPNAWVANLADPNPDVVLEWEEQVSIKNIDLFFDTDYDHPMESVLMEHAEEIIPFCIKSYYILDDKGEIVYKASDNHQTRNHIVFDHPVNTKSLTIKVEHPSTLVPASIFSIRCYRA